MQTPTIQKQHEPVINVEIDDLSNEQILDMFEKTLELIYLKVAEAAYLLLELEKRGYDTKKLRRMPIVEAVRNVGIGILTKEAFAAYYGRTDILRCMTALPVDKQIELVEVGTVQVFDHVNGKNTHRLIDIDELTPRECVLVFDTKGHKVREPGEQAKYLAGERLKEKMVRPEFIYDERSGILTCKNATPTQIMAYIKKHGLG